MGHVSRVCRSKKGRAVQTVSVQVVLEESVDETLVYPLHAVTTQTSSYHTNNSGGERRRPESRVHVLHSKISSAGKTWTLDSGLDSWIALWTEIWTNFWTESLMVTTISKHTFCSISSKQVTLCSRQYHVDRI